MPKNYLRSYCAGVNPTKTYQKCRAYMIKMLQRKRGPSPCHSAGAHPAQEHITLLGVRAHVQLQVVETVPVARLQRRQLAGLLAHRVRLRWV